MPKTTSSFTHTLPARRRALHATAWLGLALGLGHASHARADADAGANAAAAFLRPSFAFVQAGSAQDTRALTVGLGWDLPYRWKLGPGELSSYVEASYAYWQIQSADRAGRSGVSQLALIPVLRFRPDDGASPWFFEAGLGVTATSSIYRTRRKSFSTSFNFGTHLAVGRSFGEQNRHEIALRLEHFSNAGIKHPNPGANFVQIRYARRF